MPHSPLASPSATIAVLKRHGLSTRKRLGQHFLIDDNVVGRIIELARLEPGDTVLEVGPGIGTLTAALCSAAGDVVAVEKDAALLPALAEIAEGCPRLRVVHGDALRVSPLDLRAPSGPPTALVANLPYSVAATVVLHLFEELPAIGSATVMVQAEVAERMSAEPGGKDYGAYTVKLRLLAEPAGRFPVARSCFLPPPRVDSAVIRLDRVGRDEPAGLLGDAGRVAEAAFGQRRKTLRNSLSAGLGADVRAAETALRDAGLDPDLRAENVDVEGYVALARACRARGLLP